MGAAEKSGSGRKSGIVLHRVMCPKTHSNGFKKEKKEKKRKEKSVTGPSLTCRNQSFVRCHGSQVTPPDN